MSKICAVIVTYNRKECLKRCVDSILNQTVKVDKILIIDNASSDGTQEFLSSEGYLALPVVDYKRLDENIGGAGGFNKGMGIAFDEGYDWIWAMDDDGIPSSTCLEKLLNAFNETGAKYVAPLVINIENENELSFGLYSSECRKIIRDRNYFEKRGIRYFYGEANPFNGVLIHRDIIDAVGLPKAEMFIWGDETEYLMRVKKHKFDVVTCIDAIHKHPKDRVTVKRTLMGFAGVAVTGDRFRDYVRARNHAYIYSRYYPRLELVKFFILYVYYYLITDRLNFRGLYLFLKAFIDGITDNFSKHQNYR